ncbi:probable protein kinase DDB_G0277539 [Episyrphus balteatus]|uniref:probable protein kinase DDB_G0277539 n=1 Tax=Episyrphus balteatus TaxID=286459 RepID=UPI002484E65A|nr:probable protein kinase DDB_G0277539 [Episyrphus balteatus]
MKNSARKLIRKISKTSLSSTTIITTVSNKPDLITLQQQQLQIQQLQQQQQHQQQQQRSSLFKGSSSNSNSNLLNLINNENRLDSLPIQIDSLNNNNSYNQSNQTNGGNNNETSTTTATAAAASHHHQSAKDTTINISNIQGYDERSNMTKAKKSLLNFRSFDFHIKSLYSGLRHSKNTPETAVHHQHTQQRSETHTNGNNGHNNPVAAHNRTPPYLRVEEVDIEESENLLLDYPQSPYSSRRNSEDNRSSANLLQINQFDMSISQGSSPYFLSPIPISGNIRRSSTSDIMCKRSSAGSSASSSRRPSTSDLLRKARERKGSESSSRIGRSVSHGGLPRGGGGGGGRGGGGRRTSIAC